MCMPRWTRGGAVWWAVPRAGEIWAVKISLSAEDGDHGSNTSVWFFVGNSQSRRYMGLKQCRVLHITRLLLLKSLKQKDSEMIGLALIYWQFWKTIKTIHQIPE